MNEDAINAARYAAAIRRMQAAKLHPSTKWRLRRADPERLLIWAARDELSPGRAEDHARSVLGPILMGEEGDAT